MGGMFDSKTDKAKRKQELTLKEEKARRKKRAITTTVTAVFFLVVGAAILLNSNWLRRTLPVVTIDTVSFSATEFEYFFNTEFMNMASEYEQQGFSFLLPDRNRPLSSQEYDSETGDTWADIVTARALKTMQEITGIYNAAVADGFTLPEERYDDIEYEMQMNELYAQMYGYPSPESYLQLVFGSGMNEKILREILEFIFTAQEYTAYIHRLPQFTPEQLDEYYTQNADMLDVFRYRVFIVTAEEYGIDEEYSDEAHEAALAVAGEIAGTYANSIETEEDFLLAAMDYNKELYGEPEATLYEFQGEMLNDSSYINVIFSSWLQDTGRVNGDTVTFDVPQGTAVLFFLERNSNNYMTVNMRQILLSRENISPNDYPEGDDDTDYINALETAANEVRIRAQLVDSLFTEAGRSEDALLTLMEEHSDDTTPGGLYEGISQFQYQGADFYSMRVVPELEQWLFDADRAVGDSSMIETQAYGYHLLYFTGYGEQFSRVIAEDKLRIEYGDTWHENLIRGEPVRHGAFILVNI